MNLDPFDVEMDKLARAEAMAKWANKGKKFSQMLAAYKKEIECEHRFKLDFAKWLPNLGYCMKPLVPGEMMCVLSDTGSGKTVLLQNLVTKVCSPMKTLFFEMEIPDSQLVERFFSINRMDSIDKVESMVKQGQGADVSEALDHLIVYSEAAFSVKDLETIIDFEQPKVVIVDYIGLIRHTGKSRYEKLSDIAEELKLLASTKKVVLIVACQVARKKDAVSGEIFLHDAKDSGSIENSAQRAIGLWREGEKGEDVKIKVLKNQGLRDMIVSARLNVQTLNVY